jgi:transposase-like protein
MLESLLGQHEDFLRPEAVSQEVIQEEVVEFVGTHEVLGIFNMSRESSTGWGDIFDKLKDRGMQHIGLMVTDGIKGLDIVIGGKFPGTPLQQCVTHLKRNLFAKVRHGDKAYMSYLNYVPKIQAMIYTTNWIERLNRDFRRVTRMRMGLWLSLQRLFPRQPYIKINKFMSLYKTMRINH